MKTPTINNTLHFMNNSGYANDPKRFTISMQVEAADAHVRVTSALGAVKAGSWFAHLTLPGLLRLRAMYAAHARNAYDLYLESLKS